MEEHKAELVQKLLELGGENYTFEDLKRDVEAFELDSDTGGIEQSKLAISILNVTRNNKKGDENITRNSIVEVQQQMGKPSLLISSMLGRGRSFPNRYENSILER